MGTQRIISVNYLSGKPLICANFLERIVTSNFRVMRNLMSVEFQIFKNVVLGTQKGQLFIFGKATRPEVFGK